MDISLEGDHVTVKIEPKFKLGQVVMTAGISGLMHEDGYFASWVSQCLGKYMLGDWGDTCEEDAQRNDEALKDGERILASYEKTRLENGDMTIYHIWIITEGDRSVTTILFPEEY